jgi:4-amino-4-deoxy-L-arabinose transferase-like glycosyltransferase
MRPGHLSEEIRNFQPSWTHWVALGAGLILSFLFLLGTRGLNEPDEGRYANIAQEMLEPEHSVLDPQMSDLGHYDKPPLIYWVTALSFRVWGLSEWAARLPSVAGAVMALVGLGWAAWRLYGNRCAWVAVLIGGTMVHVWVMARVLTPDMLLTGWCALAVAAWAESRHRGGDWRPWACQVFFWSMAWWTKATPMLIPLLGLVLYAWVNGGKLDRRALRLPWLLVFVFVLGCPWFVYMVRARPELKDFFLHREL